MSNSALLNEALASGEGIVRLAPCWVPRSFLMPGGRLKLDTRDLYALGAHRGGIDERWFASTTNADNGPGTPEDEGLAYIAMNGTRILLKEAIETIGDKFLGAAVMEREGGWNLLCKFFDNLGPIPHHMHQNEEFAQRVGAKGKPEAYYFPPQYNFKDNNFPYTFMGLNPGTTRDDVRRCLERWNEGDNGILYHSRAYRLKPGSGWQVDAGILHAPGSLVTYEPQVNSDVFGMYQSMVEGRAVPWALLVKDMPEEKHHDLDFIIGQLDWEKNVDTHFKESNYLEPIIAEQEEGWVDRWIVYGQVDGKQLFSAKELTLDPGAKCTLIDPGASSWITVQGRGRMGSLNLQTPAMIRFGALTEDEVFISHEAATTGVEIENTGSEPLVGLRYFGPDTFDTVPNVGDYRK